MSNMSDSFVKSGGALGRVIALMVALPAAMVTALFEGEWSTKAQGILAAAAAVGQAFGEAVVKAAPDLARMLVAGDLDAAAGVMLKLWQILKGGNSREDNDLLPD